MRTGIFFSAKFLLFLVLYFSTMAVIDAIIPSKIQVKPDTVTVLALIVQIMFNSVVLVYLTKRLSLRGFNLVITSAMIVYGMQIFMTQMETWIFKGAFPMIDSYELIKLFVGGFIHFLILGTAAFFIFRNKDTVTVAAAIDYRRLASGWVWKVPLLSIVYMILYVTFGLLVAWRSEELRNFYSAHISDLNFLTLRIIQVLRGLLWILLCLPIVLWLKGNRVEKIISASLCLALLPTILLLFPNPFMPTGVRLTHFVEIFLSNGIFGIILGSLLTIRVQHNANR